MPRSEDQYLVGYGLRWTVMVPFGRDSATGKPRFHRKPIRGPKMNARAYRDWYVGLLAAGDPPKETVSQAELKELSDLEWKAAAFKEKLLARVQAGAKIEPGLRGLS
jgi:hypothetical protein